MKRATVTVHTPDGERYDFRVARPFFTVGRSPDCDLALPAAEVSNNHAEFRVDAKSGRVEVVDLGSKNGTFLNGERVEAQTPTEVGPDDELRVAGVKLNVRMTSREDRSESLSLETSHSLSRSLLRGLLGQAVRQNRASLEVVDGPAIGLKYAIEETIQRLRVGRGPDVEIDLEDDAFGTTPLLVLLNEHSYHLVPTPNPPVFIGRTPLERPRVLRHGDRFIVGGSTLEFRDPLQAAIDELLALEADDAGATRPVDGGQREPTPGMDERFVRTIQQPMVSAKRWGWTERVLFGFAVVALLGAIAFLLMVLGVFAPP